VLRLNINGHDDQVKKKLIAGIVLTGGGSQVKHLKQLVRIHHGTDTRIGIQSEHFSGDQTGNRKSV